MRAGSLEVLCFGVGGRTFAIDIQTIREILKPRSVTPVPHAPGHVAGVLNLRGAMVPVIDLHRALLGRPAEDGRGEPKLVVVSARSRCAALQVDHVYDVLSVRLEELSPLPGAEDPGDAVVVGAFRRDVGGGGPEVVLLVRTGALTAGQTLAGTGMLP